MRQHTDDRSARSRDQDAASVGPRSPGPGKRTLTGALDSPAPGRGGPGTSPPPPSALPAQARPPATAAGDATPQALFGSHARAAGLSPLGAGGAPAGEQSMQAIATEGTRGVGQPLPYRDRIQAAFGRHDIGGVRAHTDDAATAANQRLGANGYATGGAVAFRGAPDLHLAAHEAAHVVQQRGGVQLSAIGAAGDSHERHADAVADRVVAGGSAEALLDAYAGAGSAPASSGGPAVQRQLKETNLDGHYYDTRGYGYGFVHVGGNYYRVTDNSGVYQYFPGTRQYVSDGGIHFDPATENRLRPNPQDPRWLYRCDGTLGWYYYDYTSFRYVLYVPPQPQLIQHNNQQNWDEQSWGQNNNHQQNWGQNNHQQNWGQQDWGQNNHQQNSGEHELKDDQRDEPKQPTISNHQPRTWQHNGTYWESSDGYSYFASKGLLMKDYQRVDNPSIAGEVQPLEEQRSRESRQNHNLRTLVPKQRERSTDDRIRDLYRIEVEGSEIRFFTDDGKLAGEISWYDKGGKLSFDVSKLEKFEGEHAGIGSMLIYWLTKHGNTGYHEAQIEAFESQRGGSSRLQQWYMKHGFDWGMHGFVSEICQESELQAKAKLK